MRAEAIKMHEAILSCIPTTLMYGPRQFASWGYKYSAIHRIQTERSYQIWEVLNGTYDCYTPLYSDGIG